MRRISLIFLVLVGGALAFDLIPWETGQWVTYADDSGEALFEAGLIELPDRSEGLWLQMEITLPEIGDIVAQMSLKEDGVKLIQEEIAKYIEDPEAQEIDFTDPGWLLDYSERIWDEIIIGVDSPELGDRVVLSLEPEFLRSLIEDFAPLGTTALEQSESPPIVYEVTDPVEVEVPAGSYACREIAHDYGTSWYIEEIPLFGIVRVIIQNNEHEVDIEAELADFGLSGAADALDGWPAPIPLETFFENLMTGQEYEPYTEEEARGNKKPGR